MQPLLPTLSVPLSAAQAVRVHGWLNPHRWLSWDTLTRRRDLTFSKTLALLKGDKRVVVLRSENNSHHVERDRENYTAVLHMLYALQPNVCQWILEEKVTITDYEQLHTLWVVDPLTDFGGQIKIGELLLAGLSFEALKGCRLTVDALFGCGMTAENMSLFRFTLHQWLDLGLGSKHLDAFSFSNTELVFGVTKHSLESTLRPWPR